MKRKRKPQPPWMMRCSVCGQQAEVSHPDGYGEQTYYCALHEPATLLTVIEETEREEG